MTDPANGGNPDTASDDEPVLADALAPRALNQKALERMRVAVAREWRIAYPPRARRAPGSRWWVLGAAAALSAVALVVWVAKPSLQAPSIGSMSRLEGVLAVGSGLLDRRTLARGDRLRVGDRLRTTSPVLVTLERGGTLRIAAGSRLSVNGTSELALERGLIYLDLPPGVNAAKPLRVITRAGAIEHVGTEFEIMSDEHAVRVRVREGRIRFFGRSDTLDADAGTELLVAPGKSIAQRPIETYGRDWQWTAALAPDYDIEGRPLIGFLQWVSRELGRPLDFADADARKIADRTILHGSVRHQAPIEAMSNVLATTSLTYEIRGETIWVRSGTASL